MTKMDPLSECNMMNTNLDILTWFRFYPVYLQMLKFSSSLNKMEPKIASRNMKNLIQNPVSCYAVAGHESLEKSHE